jgi:hypothetical protein
MYKHLFIPFVMASTLAGCSQQDPAPAKVVVPAPAAAMPVVSIKPLPPTGSTAKELTTADAQRHLSTKFDQDGDGRVSLREMLANALAQQFQADTNKDGVLSTEEFHRGLGDIAGTDHVIEELFVTLDENRNGTLDEQEIARRAWAGIVPLDANHDGFVDAGESRALPKSTK